MSVYINMSTLRDEDILRFFMLRPLIGGRPRTSLSHSDVTLTLTHCSARAHECMRSEMEVRKGKEGKASKALLNDHFKFI